MSEAWKSNDKPVCIGHLRSVVRGLFYVYAFLAMRVRTSLRGFGLCDADGHVDIADREHARHEHLARDGPFVERSGALEEDVYTVENRQILLLAADQRAFLAEECLLFAKHEAEPLGVHAPPTVGVNEKPSKAKAYEGRNAIYLDVISI